LSTETTKLYNLLVAGRDGVWNGREEKLDADRFLEKTDDGLKKRLASLDDAAVRELTSLPTLFAYETPVGADARIGWVTGIERYGKIMSFAFQLDPAQPPIPPKKLEELRHELHIDDWELNRTHWAVKRVDVLSVLGNAATILAATRAAKGEYRFSRQTILKTCDMLHHLGHTDLDRFLLEVGIKDLDAGRGRGTRMQRMNAVAEYVLANPDARTAEGELFALAVVQRAAKSDPDYPAARYDMTDEVRAGFWTALKSDGYAFLKGRIVADVQEAPRDPPYAQRKPIASIPKPAPSAAPIARAQVSHAKPRIFLVHGRDDGAMHEVARYLERIGLDPVILRERPNAGRTLITKFQEESADIHFAVVLMTPDDIGGLGSAAQRPRARQNVIFELGFFVGKLGPGRVCALVSGEIERPSDLDGVVYVQFGSSTEWKTLLARELHEAKVPFDTTRIF
jgi:predicted nucleotide-binding protein